MKLQKSLARFQASSIFCTQASPKERVTLAPYIAARWTDDASCAIAS